MKKRIAAIFMMVVMLVTALPIVSASASAELKAFDLMVVRPPYHKGHNNYVTIRHDLKDSRIGLTMAGKLYRGIEFSPRSDNTAFAMFNLGGQFTRLTATISHIDGRNNRVGKLEFWFDGVFHQEVALSFTMMPYELDLDVSGVSQLRIVCVGTNSSAAGYRNYGFGNPTLHAPFLLGHVLGNADVTTADALEILKYIVQLPGAISSCDNARKAAAITGGNITTADALEILKKIVKLPNRIDGTA